MMCPPPRDTLVMLRMHENENSIGHSSNYLIELISEEHRKIVNCNLQPTLIHTVYASVVII
jgi:hypothetical protein